MTKQNKDENSPSQVPFLETLKETRTLVISDAVDSKLAKIMIQQILFLEKESQKLPIKLFINSPGGEISSGFAIYDLLKFVPCPVTSVVVGLAASMGSLLSLVGDKNKVFCLPNAKIMIHQPLLGGAQGSASDLEIHSKEILKTKKKIAEIYAQKTKKTVKKIVEDMNRDHWMDAKEALDYGLVDKILTKRSELP